MTSSTRPAVYWLIIALVALMTYRIVPIFPYAELGDTIPISWTLAFNGDIFMVLTAPIVAYLLVRQTGLWVWTIAIVWHALGIKDYINGITLSRIDPDPNTPPELIWVLVVGAVLQIINIVLLSRPAVRAYFLKS